ncbi:type VI secretion system membrane subunit [Pseudomonas sp. 3A(2025)]
MNYLDLVVAGVLLLVIVVFFVWRFCAVHLSGASRSFYQAVREWELNLGVNDRYETPWLLMVGDDALATPLLQGWGLQSTTRPAWFGRWWYGPDGAVLVVPGALFNHGENASVQLKLWRQLLGLLVQSRARRPLDAVIWLSTVEHLLDDQHSVVTAQAARRKFIDLQQRLGLSLPVYMVFSGGEGVPGLVNLINALPTSTYDLPLGWTSPYTAQTAWHPSWITQAVSQMQQSIEGLIVELGTLRGETDADLYQLPHHLQALHDPLQTLCDPVFQGNALGEAPRLRGVYFTVAGNAVLHRELPADFDPFAEDSEQGSEPPLFTRRLWRQRIVAEQGLAQPISRILQLRQRWHRMLGLGALALGLIWLLGMLWMWNVRTQDAERLARLLNDNNGLVAQGQDDEIARQRINGFWHLLSATPRWQLSTAVLPGSRFYGLDQRLEQTLQQRAREQLFSPIRQRLENDRNQLGTAQPAQSTTANSDEAWQQAVRIVDDAQKLERRSNLFNQGIEVSERPLDEASLLANELFGLALQPRNLSLDEQYQRMLNDPELPLAASLDLAPIKNQVAQRYLAATRLWLDTLFASADFSQLATILNSHLSKLQAGQRTSLTELEEIDASIDRLRLLIAQTNAAWSQNTSTELTAGYKEVMQRARQSSLIGPAVVDQIENYAKTTKRTFYDRWLERGDQQQSVLRQQSGGTLELQSNLEKLDQSIQILMREEFIQAAMNQTSLLPRTSDGLRNIDNNGLVAVLQYYASYQNFLTQQVAELPPVYRKGLIASARWAVDVAMWQRLTTRADTPQSWLNNASQPFDLPLDKALQLLQAVADVGDNRQVELLRQEFNSRALSELRRTVNDLQSLPVLRSPIDFSRWDGTRNLALRSYREPDVASLKQSMSRQYTLIIDALSQVNPSIEWLTSQRDFLSGSDLDLIDSIGDTVRSMKKFSEQNPTSPALMYQQLVTHEFNEMDMSNCNKLLTTSLLPQESGRFSVLARTSWDAARQRCSALQNYTSAVAWQQMSVYFNTYLAGRFPFSNKESAVDANPDRVREFLELIDKYLADAYKGLPDSLSSNSGAAAEFLFNLQKARAWLGPILIRDKEGLRGLDLEVRWRSDREEERGADQIIEWSLETGPRQVSYPAEAISHANWTVGEPVNLTLRWAQGSNQRPLDDPRQTALAVTDLSASWGYEGPWALLRMIRANQAINHFTAQGDGDRPLALQLPLRTQSRNAGALMFLRFSLKAIGGKQPLTLSELPVRVPPSPYPTIDPLPALTTTAEFTP